MAVVAPHKEALPDIELGAAGFLVIASVNVLLVPQLLVACTVILPAIVPADTLVSMELVPCPEVIVTPDGTVQL